MKNDQVRQIRTRNYAIARYMGISHPFAGQRHTFNYHADWNALMTVVERIRDDFFSRSDATKHGFSINRFELNIWGLFIVAYHYEETENGMPWKKYRYLYQYVPDQDYEINECHSYREAVWLTISDFCLDLVRLGKFPDAELPEVTP